ncbi:MAG: hypothetical protein Q9159_005700 [Coniocarpon cinnabarinum]
MPKKHSRPSPLPEDISEIYKFHLLPERSVANVCGLVVDYLPTTRSKGIDYQKVITIKDVYEDLNPDFTKRKPNVLIIKLFSRETALFPPVERTGDVIFFRRLKAVTWQGERRGLSEYGTTFAVFLSEGLLDPSIRHGLEVVEPHGKATYLRPENTGDASKELVDYATRLGRTLRDYEDQSATSVLDTTAMPHQRGTFHPQLAAQQQPPMHNVYPNNPQTAPRAPQDFQPASFFDQRYLQLKDLTPQAYSATIIGEIVKIFDSYNYLDVYVTDYTASPLLYDRQETINSYNNRTFSGPLGRMTLKVEVHMPHREAIRAHFVEKELIMLRNVRCKMANSGEGLEGTLWPDRKYLDKIHAVKPDPRDARVVQMMQRKEIHFGVPAATAVENTKAATNKKKKEKKVRKERERQEAEQRGNSSVKPITSASGPNIAPEIVADESAAKLVQRDPSKTGNNHVQDGNAKSPHPRPPWANQRISTSRSNQYSSFDDVLHNPKRQIVVPLENGIATALIEVPFVNVNHRVLLRVADYHPKDVWDFVRPVEPSGATSPPNQQYQWDVMLLAISGEQDRRSLRDRDLETISIHVDNEAGESLFGLPARAIIYDEDDQKALDKAQEKFFALMGAELPNAKEASSKSSSEQHSPAQSRRGSEQFPHWNRERSKLGHPAVSLPFEACIQEFGVRCENEGMGDYHIGCDQCKHGWRRLYGLHSTSIVERDLAALTARVPDEGRTIGSAIVLEDSDVEMIDPT